MIDKQNIELDNPGQTDDSALEFLDTLIQNSALPVDEEPASTDEELVQFVFMPGKQPTTRKSPLEGLSLDPKVVGGLAAGLLVVVLAAWQIVPRLAGSSGSGRSAMQSAAESTEVAADQTINSVSTSVAAASGTLDAALAAEQAATLQRKTDASNLRSQLIAQQQAYAEESYQYEEPSWEYTEESYDEGYSEPAYEEWTEPEAVGYVEYTDDGQWSESEG